MERLKKRGIAGAPAGALFMAAAVVVALAVLLALSGCSSQQGGSVSDAASSSAASEAVAGEVEQLADDLRVVSMKGATSVGLASMMQQEQGQFTVVAAADEASALLLQDEVDIACVPANLAATLYQKTGGAIRVLDVNTLGVLYVVAADEAVSSVDALAGRTVCMTGKGTVPEYTLRALLAASGMSMDEVSVEFKSEPAEVVALLTQDADVVGILPQPYATSATLKNPDLKITLDLNAAWAEAAGDEGGSIVTGVTIAKASTVEENPAAIDEFLRRHAASVDVAKGDSEGIADTVVELGIIDNEAIARQAIPLCNVACLTGHDMKAALSGYLAALFAQDPASVGGSLPDDAFYYGASVDAGDAA